MIINGITPLARVNHSAALTGPARNIVRLVNLNDIFSVAMQRGFAVPAINIRAFPIPKGGNYENGYLGPSTAVAVLRAMKQLNSPVIIEIAQSEYGYAGPKSLFGEKEGFKQIVTHIVAEATRMEVTQPLVIHFDHGSKTELMKYAVEGGFTSVALDGGNIEDWDQLLAKAREWVDYCHTKGISVEGEIELVDKADPTDPKEAIEFVNRTGVDVIVVTLPENVHGAAQGASRLDLPRLLEVHNAIPKTPVNLHGGSGFSFEDLAAAVEAGAAHKVNYATNVQRAMFKAVPELLVQLNELALRAGVIKPEEMAKAEKDAKVARKALYTLVEGPNSIIAAMGIDRVKVAEDAMTAEIIKLMQTLKNVDTARFYPE